MSFSTSDEAIGARALVEDLQRQLVARLERAARGQGVTAPLEAVSWVRDGGRHGGGTRYQTGDNRAFDRASVNMSAVHYDDMPAKQLGSATAISAIVHPRHPHAPSMHLHVSYTAMRDGRGYWRIMADLNPSIPDEQDTARFEAALRHAAPEAFDAARAQGDKYFWIPALGRHRGVTHFYLEGHRSGDWAADRDLARAVGQATIETYGDIVQGAWHRHPSPTAEDRALQLAYHTLYLFQVLTLDRGTTSGLMVHGDNDLGILGSLPSRVDRRLLGSWAARVPPPQDALVAELVAALPDASPAPVTAEAKRALAHAVREHYRAHPEALALQASGDVLPPTVENHR